MNDGTIEPGLDGPAIQKAHDSGGERGVGCVGEGTGTESSGITYYTTGGDGNGWRMVWSQNETGKPGDRVTKSVKPHASNQSVSSTSGPVWRAAWFELGSEMPRLPLSVRSAVLTFTGVLRRHSFYMAPLCGNTVNQPGSQQASRGDMVPAHE